MKEGAALLTLLVKPHKLTIGFILAYVAILVSLAPVLHSKAFPVFFILTMPAVMQWLVLVAQIGYSKPDLTARGSGYPDFFLRLPVTTGKLALWPVLATIGGSTAFWLIFAYGYLLRVGVELPVSLVISIVGAVLGAIFAVSWHPFERGIFRVISITCVLAALGALGFWWIASSLLPRTYLTDVYFAIAVAELFVCCHSVKMSRQNISIAPARSPSSGNRSAHMPFASARAAKFWMEWKLRGRVFPYTVAAFAAVLSLPLPFMAQVPTEILPHVQANGWIPMGLPVLVIGTLLISALLRPDAAATQVDNTPFFLTLPITNSQILSAKRFEQSTSVAITLVFVLLVGVGWLMLPASVDGVNSPLLLVLLRSSSSTQIAAVTLELALLSAVIWRNRTVWTFTSCFKDVNRVRMLNLLSMMAPIVLGAPIAIAFDSGSTLKSFFPYVPWILAAVVVVKLAATYVIARRLVAVSASERTACRNMAACWLLGVAVTATAVSILVSLLPSQQTAIAPHSIPCILLGTTLIVPLVRPMAARLILHSSRHS